MQNLLTNAFGFLCAIAAGYLLQQTGAFAENGHKVISCIVLQITAPAAIIINFSAMQIGFRALFLILPGILCNLVLCAVGWTVSRHASKENRMFWMLCLPGFNIGTFALPFAQNFLGPEGTVPACIFDIGNSTMCMGGNFALASIIFANSAGEASRREKRRMPRSVPFLTCLLMTVFSLIGLKLPDFLVQTADLAGRANAFLAMLMLGSMLRLRAGPEDVRQVRKLLTLRYTCAILLSALVWLAVPQSAEVRKAIIFCFFAPVSALAPVFAEQGKGNTQAAGLAGSFSILVSMAAMTLVLILIQ